MTSAHYIASLIALLWVIGWIATVRDTGTLPDTSWLKRTMGIVVMFFIWPAVAWAMTNPRH